jgi:hypothetical protein
LNKFLSAYHPDIYKFNFNLKKFFREEEDRRRQSRAVRLAHQRAATASGVALAPPPVNFFTRRSAELKLICVDYQNGNFVTNPIRTGVIRFLSEVAAILMHRPPGGGV